MGMAIKPAYVAVLSLVLAMAAATNTMLRAPGGALPNLRPWVPVAVAALALFVRNKWGYLTAMLLLCVFVVLGAASVGVFYVPAALAMAIAMALSFRLGNT